MSGKHRFLVSCIGVLAVAGVTFAGSPLADVSYFASSVEFSPRAWGHGFVLKVSAPDGSVVQKTVKDGVLSFDLSELEGAIIDGRYNYELHPLASPARDQTDKAAPPRASNKPRIKVSSLSGSFLVSGGSIVSPGRMEPQATSGGPDAPDAEISEDLCVGAGCASGETYHAQATIKLKEADAGIQFEDTSIDVDWPTNDWLIHANDSFQGGAEYLAIRDLDAGTTPLKVEATAPNDSLHISASGFVGIGTSAPSQDLHIRTASSPVVRLEQYSGTPQTWDLYGSSSYIYLYDFTHNRYPFIISSNAPDYGIALKADGKMGFGTFTPDYQFEVERSGVNSVVVVDRTDGAQNYINATASFGNFGTVSDHPLRLVVNSSWQMRINNDSSISMANGAALTAGGVWTDSSSRALKQDIEGLSVEEATAALTGLEPVKFAYKSNGERHVGFIAEDVPDLVADADRNGLSPMDVVAVLTRVVQQQQIVYQKQKKALQSQQQRLQEQQMLTESLQTTIDQLMSRISALESR